MATKTKFEVKLDKVEEILGPKIRIIGIGGGGNAIVSRIAQKVKSTSFVVADIDEKVLKELPRRIQHFLFDGESEKKAKTLFEGIDFCILVACLGGEASSAILPVFAEISQRRKVVTLGIFLLPFEFEGEKKTGLAEFSLEKIRPNLNASVIISNQKLFNILNKNTPFKEAFFIANRWVAECLEGLIEVLYSSGLIGIDLAELKMVLAGRGKLAFLNTVEEEASKSIQGIARRAVYNRLSPYLAYKAERILFNITGGENLSINAVNQIGSIISKLINPRAKISFGVTQDKKYQDKIRITLLASGCEWQE